MNPWPLAVLLLTGCAGQRYAMPAAALHDLVVVNAGPDPLVALVATLVRLACVGACVGFLALIGAVVWQSRTLLYLAAGCAAGVLVAVELARDLPFILSLIKWAIAIGAAGTLAGLAWHYRAAIGIAGRYGDAMEVIASRIDPTAVAVAKLAHIKSRGGVVAETIRRVRKPWTCRVLGRGDPAPVAAPAL